MNKAIELFEKACSLNHKGAFYNLALIYNNGEEMKHRGTSADKAFKHGVGKIYLLK